MHGPYSYSRVSTYRQCPLKFKFHYIDKLQLDGADRSAAERGQRIHELAEDIVRRKKSPTYEPVSGGKGERPAHPDASPAVDHYQEWLHKLRLSGTWKSELEVGATRKMRPCGYWDSDCYVRGKIDLIEVTDLTLDVRDIKTGSLVKQTGRVNRNRTVDHFKQIKLYIGMAMVKYDIDPDATHITGGVYYVDAIPKDRVVQEEVYDGLEVLRNFIVECRMIDVCRSWPARVSPLCGWCDYSKSNGGPCHAA